MVVWELRGKGCRRREDRWEGFVERKVEVWERRCSMVVGALAFLTRVVQGLAVVCSAGARGLGQMRLAVAS